MNILTEMKKAYESSADFSEEKKGRYGDRKWTNNFKKWLATVVADEHHTMRERAQKMLALYDGPPTRNLTIPTIDNYKIQFDLKLKFVTRYQGDVLGLRAYVSFSSIKQRHIEKVDDFMKKSIDAFKELAKSYGLSPTTEGDEKDFVISNAGYYCLMERWFYIQLTDKTVNMDYDMDYDLLQLLGVEYDKH